MAQQITVQPDTIIEVTVSKRVDRNGRGIICQIPGNPDGYLPLSTLIGKDEAAQKARMAEINVPGTKLEVLVTEARMKDVDGKKVSSIRLHEFRVAGFRRAMERQGREETLKAELAKIAIGDIVDAVVVGPAETDSKRTPGTKFQFGVHVDIGEHNALLHSKEVAGDDMKAQNRRLGQLSTGKVVTVKIIGAKVEYGRLLIDVSEKQAEAEEAMASLSTGNKYSATVLGLDSVDDVHGVMVVVAGVKCFLPEDDACVKDIAALTRGKNQTTRVIITDATIGGFVKVTRKGV